ncbi:MAG: SDR family oxidoreductase [Planctomycetota bacterium]
MAQQVVLVTGASTGFGRLTSEALARKGHRVFATMRGVDGKNKEHADALRQLATNEGLPIEVIELDVASDSSVNNAVAGVIEQAGRLDVVVNNAGIFGMAPTEAFGVDQYAQILDVNAVGPFRLMKAALPQMREQQQGLFVHVSSLLGRLVFPGAAAYNSSKFALEGFVETISLETRSFGIEHTIVEPGAFATEIFGKNVEPSDGSTAEAYSELTQTLEQIGAGLQAFFEGGSGKPTDVSDAIVAAIEAAPGSRPLRVAVGDDGDPVRALNEQAISHQAAFLAQVGLSPEGQPAGA